MIPGEVITKEGDLEFNVGRESVNIFIFMKPMMLYSSIVRRQKAFVLILLQEQQFVLNLGRVVISNWWLWRVSEKFMDLQVESWGN